MTTPAVFQFPATGQSVRAVEIDGEPRLVAADVTTVLGYGGGARNAVARLPERMKGVAEINTPGGTQRMTVVNEAGAYRLVMRSNLDQAERFQDWLAEEVVPTIRRTGRYEATQRPELPQSYAAALRELASTVEQRDAAQSALAVAEPKAEAWDVLASAHGDYSVREAAAMLCRAGVDTGQNRLFALLREWGLIDRADRPYASHLRHVVLRPRSYRHPLTGEEQITSQVRITADGLRYVYRRLTGENLPVVAS